MRTLFADLTVQAERKMEAVMNEPLERPLSKVLQRGEDLQFDQLLSALGSVAEHCLPSLLRSLFGWYDRQMAEGAVPELRKVDVKGKRYFYSLNFELINFFKVMRSLRKVKLSWHMNGGT